MLRPSYNEQIHGFGFNVQSTLTGTETSTQAIFSPTCDVVSEVVGDQGSVLIATGNTNKLNVLTAHQAGFGAFIGLSADERQCYSYSMNGVAKSGGEALFAFVGTLEVAHAVDVVKTCNIMACLPIHVSNQIDLRVGFHSAGFVRPNINPEGYANIGNVTGLIFGVAILNSSGGTIAFNMLMSCEIQRWVDPDVNIHTPVV